jgi:3,4-dihydroxy 2-butanone 4-phosphate synthase/GTP cyclohydrolase II
MEPLKIDRVACARIPTGQGEYQLCLYTNNRDEKEHMALVMGAISGKSNVLVRVHSECFTGDVLGSRRCDCGEQLQLSMQKIAEAGRGVLIYLRQEGRGIGLLDKLRAYNLQDQGYDTVDANLALGHQADERDYTLAAAILTDLEVLSIRLLTNNPGKIERLAELGVLVTERVALEPTVYADNAQYLITKAFRMNHILDLGEFSLQTAAHKNGNH